MTRTHTIVACLCCLVISCAAIAQPGPGPGPRRPHPGDGRGPGPGPGPGGGPPRPWDRDRDRDRDREPDTRPDDGHPGARVGPDSPRELNEFWEANKQKIIDFCKENSPNRWEAMERWMSMRKIGDFRPPRDKLILQIKHLMELEQADPDLYKLKVAQIRVEDEEFPMIRELRMALRNEDKPRAKELREKLQQPAAKMVELRLQERQLRLARLQKRLDEEKQRLAKDMNTQNKLVDAHVEEVINNPPGGPPPMRRPGAPVTTSQPTPEATDGGKQ
jgi:hypothetical protein